MNYYCPGQCEMYYGRTNFCTEAVWRRRTAFSLLELHLSYPQPHENTREHGTTADTHFCQWQKKQVFYSLIVRKIPLWHSDSGGDRWRRDGWHRKTMGTRERGGNHSDCSLSIWRDYQLNRARNLSSAKQTSTNEWSFESWRGAAVGPSKGAKLLESYHKYLIWNSYIALELNNSRTTVFVIAIQALWIHSLWNKYKNKEHRVLLVIHPYTKLPKI